MNLSSALYNAFTGLRANTHAAAVVSTNISNATTESYGRRSLSLSAAAAGMTGGVRVDGVTRHVDPVLLADRRSSDAALGHTDILTDFARKMEDAYGTIDSPGSLVGRVRAFENALLTAASNPASTQRLHSLAEAAKAVTDKLGALNDTVQQERERAEQSIVQQVGRLNDTLVRLDSINDSVKAADGTGADITSMLDERQKLIDGISDIVPIRIVPRERGEIAIFTQTGAPLLDRSPATIGFQPTAEISGTMREGTGILNGLTIDGHVLGPMQGRLIAGGTLAAAFEVRDDHALRRLEELDGVALEFITRFQEVPEDVTLIGDTLAGIPTDRAGLFWSGSGTDAYPLEHAATDPEAGLAALIRVNPRALDEAAPLGSSLALRNGLYFADHPTLALGPGDSRILNGMIDRLNDDSGAPQSAVFQTGNISLTGLVTNVTSTAASQRVRVEADQSFRAAQNTALKEMELRDGVDTDAELQRLMQIEQHYAANARVMSTVDELMQRLLQI